MRRWRGGGRRASATIDAHWRLMIPRCRCCFRSSSTKAGSGRPQAGAQGRPAVAGRTSRLPGLARSSFRRSPRTGNRYQITPCNPLRAVLRPLLDQAGTPPPESARTSRSPGFPPATARDGPSAERPTNPPRASKRGQIAIGWQSHPETAGPGGARLFNRCFRARTGSHNVKGWLICRGAIQRMHLQECTRQPRGPGRPMAERFNHEARR